MDNIIVKSLNQKKNSIVLNNSKFAEEIGMLN